MKNKIKLSIIVPVYNTGEEAKGLILDLLKNNGEEIEVLVVDDGSLDDSYLTMKQIKDNRLKLFRQKNKGAASARNLGLGKAKGEYISFIDSDDAVDRDFVRKMLNVVEGNDLAVCGMEYRRLNLNSKKSAFINPIENFSGNFREYILKLMLVDGRMYSSVNKIYERKIIVEGRLKFDEKLNFAEDTKFVLGYLDKVAALKKHDPKIAFILESIYIYNFGTKTSTVANSGLKWQNWEKSYEFLTEWAKEENDDLKTKAKKQKLLKRIKWRWQISYRLAIARSKKDFKFKIKKIGFLGTIIFTVLAKIRK